MSECSVQALKWGATWPSREQFHELADQGYRVIPIVRRLLADSLTPVGFYERLAAGRSGTFILESAEFGGTWNRYSFIGVNSMAQLRSNNGKADWLGQVPAGVPTEGDVMEVAHAALKTLKAPHVEGLPNLTSGLVGTVGWDAIRHWEPTLRAEAPNETGQPETVLALATDIAVVDHVSGSVWMIANAVNVDDRSTRADATRRWRDWMICSVRPPRLSKVKLASMCWMRPLASPSFVSVRRRAIMSVPLKSPSSTSSMVTCSRWSSPSRSIRRVPRASYAQPQPIHVFHVVDRCAGA